jgi:hypothetical protein
LSKYNIQTIHRKNASGFLYGISFVDHRNKSVFNGGEIGKEFSAAALQKRFGVVMLKIGESQNYSRGNSGEAISQKSIIQSKTFKNDKVPSRDIISDKLLRQLLQTGELEPKIPYELMRKKRKKKRWPGI